jgi:hypothetical protein
MRRMQAGVMSRSTFSAVLRFRSTTRPAGFGTLAVRVLGPGHTC